MFPISAAEAVDGAVPSMKVSQSPPSMLEGLSSMTLHPPNMTYQHQRPPPSSSYHRPYSDPGQGRATQRNSSCSGGGSNVQRRRVGLAKMKPSSKKRDQRTDLVEIWMTKNNALEEPNSEAKKRYAEVRRLLPSEILYF